MKYSHYTSTRFTPQSRPIPFSNQIPNNAGGYGFGVDKWIQLDRFIFAGSCDGTFYVGKWELTKQNVDAIIECIKENPQRVVNHIVEISESGRAAKLSTYLYVLALVIARADDSGRRAAYEALPKIVRTASQLFEVIESVSQMRGWGRGLRKSVASWYNELEPRNLAYQIVKYRNRNNWTHLDVLRSAHIKPVDDEHNDIFRYIKNGVNSVKWFCGDVPCYPDYMEIVYGYEALKAATSVKTACEVIAKFKLPWEAVDNKYFANPEIWAAMLPHMPVTAVIRNLGKMSSVGVTNNAEYVDMIVNALNEKRLIKDRVHPINLLAALAVYKQGHGDRGDLTWWASPQIVGALENGILATMKNVQPIGKKILVGYDVSGSMQNTAVTGMTISCAEASAVLGAVFNSVEDSVVNVAFSTDSKPMNMTMGATVSDWGKELSRYSGGTDCSQPILYATKNKLFVDAFVIITDAETWAGHNHPVQELAEYRRLINKDAKMVEMIMGANNISLFDNRDKNVLEVCGLDSGAFETVAEFIKEW
jgi:60 kDa SS-A/Ro ribonucleoprotein